MLSSQINRDEEQGLLGADPLYRIYSNDVLDLSRRGT